MNVCRSMLWIFLAAALIAGCARPAAPPPGPAKKPSAMSTRPGEVTVDDALVQFSLVAALAAGDYEGGASLSSVLANGDFGVGTFSGLDGEMIVLDGIAYQALADGQVRMADVRGATPFAAVTFFTEDGRLDHVDASSLDDLDEQLDRQLPRRNSPYAISVDADFADLTLRSVPAQPLPNQPLVEAVKHQVTWERHNVRGTLVGLRCPAWIGTVNVAGYHWHFISDDRTIGGHVLACAFRKGLVRFDECASVVIRLPQSREFDEFDAAEVNKHDIDTIERQRLPAEKP